MRIVNEMEMGDTRCPVDTGKLLGIVRQDIEKLSIWRGFGTGRKRVEERSCTYNPSKMV